MTAKLYKILYTWLGNRQPGFQGLIPSADLNLPSFGTHYVAFCCLPKQTSECDDRGHAGAVEEQDGG